MEVIDNFITEKEQRSFLSYISDPKFAYRMYKSHIFTKDQWLLEKKFHAPEQFSHFLYMHGEETRSAHFEVITPVFGALLKKYGDFTLFRAKVNLTFPYPPYMGYEPQIPHTDMKYDDGKEIPHLVCIYYINDCDGPTIFFDKEHNEVGRVEPKRGRAVIFDGSQLHAGTNPVEHPFRYILNINFREGLNQIP
jgi:hypothetical protein